MLFLSEKKTDELVQNICTIQDEIKKQEQTLAKTIEQIHLMEQSVTELFQGVYHSLTNIKQAQDLFAERQIEQEKRLLELERFLEQQGEKLCTAMASGNEAELKQILALQQIQETTAAAQRNASLALEKTIDQKLEANRVALLEESACLQKKLCGVENGQRELKTNQENSQKLIDTIIGEARAFRPDALKRLEELKQSVHGENQDLQCVQEKMEQMLSLVNHIDLNSLGTMVAQSKEELLSKLEKQEELSRMLLLGSVLSDIPDSE